MFFLGKDIFFCKKDILQKWLIALQKPIQKNMPAYCFFLKIIFQNVAFGKDSNLVYDVKIEFRNDIFKIWIMIFECNMNITFQMECVLLFLQ